MKEQPHMIHSTFANVRQTAPAGFAMLELIVAAVLLTALLACLTPLAVSAGRLWQDSQRSRLALDELSNQLETLTQLNAAEAKLALSALMVSEQVAARLPNAQLSGEILFDEDGPRISLTLRWDRVGPAKSMNLVGWLASDSAEKEELDSQEATP